MILINPKESKETKNNNNNIKMKEYKILVTNTGKLDLTYPKKI